MNAHAHTVDMNVNLTDGLKYGKADSHSRQTQVPSPASEENVEPLVMLEQGDVGEMQREDSWMRGIMQHLEHPSAPVVRKIRRAARSFRLVDGVLRRRAKGFWQDRAALVVPKSLRTEVIRHCHEDITAGHLGIRRTWEKVRRRYFWPEMFSHVTKYVATCPECQTRKPEPGFTPFFSFRGHQPPLPIDASPTFSVATRQSRAG